MYYLRYLWALLQLNTPEELTIQGASQYNRGDILYFPENTFLIIKVLNQFKVKVIKF